MSKAIHAKLLPLTLALLLAPALAPAEDLLSAYEAARQSDPVLAGAQAQKLSTEEGVSQATAQLLPQISASLAFDDSHGTSVSQNFYPDSSGNFVLVPSRASSSGRSTTLQGTLTQSILDFGKWTQRKAAREQALRGDATYRSAEQDLLIRVATTYFAVLTAEDSLTFAQAEEKALARQLDQANQRYEVGLSAITDVNEAKAQHDSATAAVINAQNALDDAREALREITGKEPGELKRLREQLPLQQPSPADAEAWVQQALEQNPTLVAQAHAVEAAKASVNTARSGHLPTLNASLVYQNSPDWTDNTGSRLPGSIHTNSERSNTAIGLTLSVPLFSGGYTQSKVRQAVYDRDAAADSYEQQKRAVIRATRNSYRAVIAGISGVEARKQAVLSAKSALEATQAGFEVGTRTIVDVLISQQQLFQAQRDYSQARHDFVLNGLKLRQGAGTIEPKDLQEVNALLE
ncbi:MAG: TolC family outer membrane protein [Lysobacterales bacterium]